MWKMWATGLVFGAAVGLWSPSGADAQGFVLPFPTSPVNVCSGAGDASLCFGSNLDATGTPRPSIRLDGVPIAFQYDEFWSYSVKLLEAIQDQTTLLPIATFGDYGKASGTGALDALVFTFTGASNDKVGATGNIHLAEPTKNPNTSGPGVDFSGTWPDAGAKAAEDQTQQVGPNPSDPNKDGVLDYLQSFDPNNVVPVFGLDLNQTGTENSLLLTAQLRICADAACTKVLGDFSLDAKNDGAYQNTAFSLAFGHVCFAPKATDCKEPTTWQGPSVSGQIYEFNNQLGSGNVDFAAFPCALTGCLTGGLNLTAFAADSFFLMRGDLDGLNDGAEEIFLLGRIGIQQVPPGVPAPATLALIGAGLTGLGLLGRLGRRRES